MLFGVPIAEMTNTVSDATAVAGTCMRELWNRLGEARTFEARVFVAESYLLRRLSSPIQCSSFHSAANYILRRKGAVRVSELATAQQIGLRQFERHFRREVGVSARTFARVARFQCALDAKLAAPEETWLEIAHRFGYYDQMHMIHDFEKLGRHSPSLLVAEMGDVRPPALSSGK